MKNWILKNKKELIIFSIYALCSLILVLFHENWRDEGQAWLIARDCNFFELLQQLKYEGHFILWYLILMPFAKLGFPYITTNIISWLITCASVWIILKKAPFKTYKKILFIFTFPMIYLFPVISRCYCLIPLAISLIAVFYKDRTEKPIRYILSIALLANTHVIMLSMVGVLLIGFYYDQIKSWKNNSPKIKKNIAISFIIIVVLLILTALPLIGSINTNQTTKKSYSLANLVDMLFKEPFKMIILNYFAFKNMYYMQIFILVLSLLFLYFDAADNKKEYTKIAIIFLWQYFIYAFIYTMSNQRAAIGILVIFFFRWIRIYDNNKQDKKKDYTKLPSYLLVALMIINIIEGAILCYYDIMYNYSSSCVTGKYINQNIPDNSIIITGNQPEFCSAIIPYIKKNIKFYEIQGYRYFTFVTWDEKNVEKLNDNFFDDIQAKFKDDNVYYVYSKYKVTKNNDEDTINNLVKNQKLTEVYDTDNSFGSSEDYKIYKINFN